MGSPHGYPASARRKAAETVRQRQAAHDEKVAPVIRHYRSMWTCSMCGEHTAVADDYLDCPDCYCHARTRRLPWPVIVETLNSGDIPPPRPGGRWNVSAVRRIAARNGIA